MMISQIDLLFAFFGSLVGAITLLLLGIFKDKKFYHAFVQYVVGLTILLNSRYFIDGPPQAIAFFVGIYDVFHNLAASNSTVALVPCLSDDPHCSILSSYDKHPNWAVAFHHRFQNAPSYRTQLLLIHIACNTMAFCLMRYQLYFPGKVGVDKQENKQHRILGKIAGVSLMVGVMSAILLSLEHGSIEDYGGNLATFGFIFMGACVLVPLYMGMTAIVVNRDVASHSKWMFRCAGSMWGSFWIFRAMELVFGPLLTNFQILSIQLCAWCSAPIGLMIAEAILRNREESILYANITSKQPEGDSNTDKKPTKDIFVNVQPKVVRM